VADFIVGSPARSDDFWFREEFIVNLWESIEKHKLLKTWRKKYYGFEYGDN
jgi:hypothetical protein